MHQFVRKVAVVDRECIVFRDAWAEIPLGSPIRLRYLDHVFYKDKNIEEQAPRILEAIGRLVHNADDYVKVNFEQYDNPEPLSTGLVILKSTIIEFGKIG